MPGSYRVDCESCGDSISAAARYCAWCGTEQQRAVDAIERMRTDGGQNADVSESEDARPRVEIEIDVTTRGEAAAEVEQREAGELTAYPRCVECDEPIRQKRYYQHEVTGEAAHVDCFEDVHGGNHGN